MKHLRHTSITIYLLVLIVVVLDGCKENTIINSNLVPTVDNIHTFQYDDSLLKIRAKTIYDDSIVTSYNVSPSYAGLGTVNDPFFGLLSASMYMQFIPVINSYSFGGTRIDSAVLILPYTGFSWGDTSLTASQKFTVYRILDEFRIDTTYYSFNRLTVDRSNPLGSATISMANIKYPDTGSLLAKPRNAYLRIKLSDDFKQKLIDSSSQYNTYPDYLKAFKGIYVEPDTTTGSTIHYFQLDGSSPYYNAGIYFYQHNTADSLVTYFGFSTSYCAHYTWVKRPANLYAGTLAAPYFHNTTDSLANDSLILLQNEPGAAIDIIIPNIQSIPKSLINKAELVITAIDKNNPMSIYSPPSRLYPVGIDESGVLYNIADRYPLTSVIPLDFIDGVLKAEMINGTSTARYHINFPRELQHAIVSGKTQLHLRINGTQTFPAAYRLIAGGKTHPDPNYRLKLNIIYSKLN